MYNQCIHHIINMIENPMYERRSANANGEGEAGMNLKRPYIVLAEAQEFLIQI